MFNKPCNPVGAAAAMLVAIAAVLMPLHTLRADTVAEPDITAEETKEIQQYVSKEKKGKEPLSWKKEKSVGSDKVWYQAVIKVSGETVTLAYFPDSSEGGLSLWWRKTGTKGNDSLWSSSVGSDGKSGGGSDPKEERLCFVSATRPAERQIGADWQPFWQNQCNTRLRAVLAYYRGK